MQCGTGVVHRQFLKGHEMKKKKGLRLLTYNLRAILFFEMTYKFAVSLIMAPFLVILLNAAIKVAGYSYLSNDNLFTFFRKPSTIILFVFALIVIMLYLFIEITALVGCFHASHLNKKVKAVDLFRIGYHNFKKVFYPTNIFVLLWIFFILPVLNIIYLIGFAFIIKIPNFIKSELVGMWKVLLVAGIIIVAAALYALLYLYCIQGLVIEKKSLFKGRKTNKSLIKGNYLQTGLKLVVWNIVIMAMAVLFFEFSIMAIVWITRTFHAGRMISVITLKSMTVMRTVMFYIYYMGFILFNTLFITNKYIKEKQKLGEELPEFEPGPQIGKHPKQLRAITFFIVMVLACNSIALFSFNKDKLTINAQIFKVPVVMAHRGASAVAPENTMEAFRLAMEQMADYIELDVQMTKDGVLVVTHDESLNRVAGINKKVWELSYEELSKIDVGSFFAPEFSYARIPTLEEVLQLTAGKIRLNIELKPSEHDKNLEENVIRLIKKYDIEDSCMICCMKYDSLQKVKEIAPDIYTTYVMIIAYSNFWDLEAADAFSISHDRINEKLVSNVKNRGKNIYAWTVNEADDVNAVLDMGVDGIITDNPALIMDVILSRLTPDTMLEFVEDAMVDIEENVVMVNTP